MKLRLFLLVETVALCFCIHGIPGVYTQLGETSEQLDEVTNWRTLLLH